MRFSQRYGFSPVKDALQVEGIDHDLLTALWNVLTEVYWQCYVPTAYNWGSSNGLYDAVRSLWRDFLKYPIDTLPANWAGIHTHVRDLFFTGNWYDVYDLIEFVASEFGTKEDRDLFKIECNQALKHELSAYRFVDRHLVRITTEDEISAIEAAIDSSAPLRPVQTHLHTALELLADRKSPDYRNSIKESISAVESVAKLLAGTPKAELSPALEELESKVGELHGALKKGILSIYGYTSDAQGIRHGLLDEPSLDLEDAQFMLVLCSGFVSYLIQKAAKAGINLR